MTNVRERLERFQNGVTVLKNEIPESKISLITFLRFLLVVKTWPLKCDVITEV